MNDDGNGFVDDVHDYDFARGAGTVTACLTNGSNYHVNIRAKNATG